MDNNTPPKDKLVPLGLQVDSPNNITPYKPLQLDTNVESVDPKGLTKDEFNERFSDTKYQYSNVDWNKAFADKQSTLDQLGNFAIQSLGEVVGGTISSVGALAEVIPAVWTEAVDNEDADFNNAIIALGDSIKQGAKDVAPIYRKNAGKSWDVSDSGWWFENAVSFASTASMLIPSYGAVKGLGYLAKLAKITDKVGDLTKYIAKVGTGAVVSRNAENFTESLQVVKDVKADLTQRFANEEEFQKVANSEIGQELAAEGRPVDKENLINFIASKAGWKSYAVNSTNVVFDALQMASAFKNPMTRIGKFGTSSEIKAAQAAAMGSTAERSLASKVGDYFNPFVSLVGNQLTEGVEEGINYYGSLSGKNLAKELSGQKTEDIDWSELSESAFWGALGGVANTAVGKAYSKITGDKTTAQYKDMRINEIQGRMNFIQDSIKKQTEIVNNDLLSDDQKVEKINLEKQKNDFDMTYHAAQAGNVDMLLDQVNNPNFKDKLVELGYETKENIDKVISRMNHNILQAESYYRKYSNKFQTLNIDNQLKSNLIFSASNLEFFNDKIKEKQNKINEELSELKGRDYYLSSTPEANVESTIKLRALERANKATQTQIAREKDSYLKTLLGKRLEENNQEIAKLKSTFTEESKEASLVGINDDIIQKQSEYILLQDSFRSNGEYLNTKLTNEKEIKIIDKEVKKQKADTIKKDLNDFKSTVDAGIKDGSLTYDNIVAQSAKEINKDKKNYLISKLNQLQNTKNNNVVKDEVTTAKDTVKANPQPVNILLEDPLLSEVDDDSILVKKPVDETQLPVETKQRLDNIIATNDVNNMYSYLYGSLSSNLVAKQYLLNKLVDRKESLLNPKIVEANQDPVLGTQDIEFNEGVYYDLEGKFNSSQDQRLDIERRRQEELKDYNTINFEELKNSEFKYRLKNSKGIVLHKSEIRYSSYNNQLEFVNTKDIGKWLSKWYPTEDYRNTNISDPDILFRVDFSQFKEQLKKFYSGDGIKFLEEFEKLINAKYDAELAALKSKTTTSSSNSVQTSSEIEAKKADIERRRQEKLDKANKQIEKTNKKEDRRLKVETYRTLDIGGNPVEVEITTNADGSRLLRARQVNEDGSIEPMAYATERINNKSQATLTNEKLIEGYIGNEDNTLQRTNVDENPNQTHIDKINAKYDAELAALAPNLNQSDIDYSTEATPENVNSIGIGAYGIFNKESFDGKTQHEEDEFGNIHITDSSTEKSFKALQDLKAGDEVIISVDTKNALYEKNKNNKDNIPLKVTTKDGVFLSWIGSLSNLKVEGERAYIEEIRNSIGTDTSKTLTTKVTKKSNGQIVNTKNWHSLEEAGLEKTEFYAIKPGTSKYYLTSLNQIYGGEERPVIKTAREAGFAAINKQSKKDVYMNPEEGSGREGTVYAVTTGMDDMLIATPLIPAKLDSRQATFVQETTRELVRLLNTRDTRISPDTDALISKLKNFIYVEDFKHYSDPTKELSYRYYSKTKDGKEARVVFSYRSVATGLKRRVICRENNFEVLEEVLDKDGKRILDDKGNPKFKNVDKNYGSYTYDFISANGKPLIQNILENKFFNIDFKRLALDEEYKSKMVGKGYLRTNVGQVFDTKGNGLGNYFSDPQSFRLSIAPISKPKLNLSDKDYSTEGTVDYNLKAINLLISDKAKQIFEKGEKNKWDLNKILTELQIPKEQKQLILDKGFKVLTNNDARVVGTTEQTLREEIITDLLANYSYGVEVNVAKTQRNWDSNDDTNLRENNNTSYYSNLTVPGGTNYTENEISTPLITPSIKGHAKFATDNGIGWFRSDEKQFKRKDNTIKSTRTWYDEQGVKHSEEIFNVQKENPKTRRILEVQSDLFQKGRDKKDLVKTETSRISNFVTTDFENSTHAYIRKNGEYLVIYKEDNTITKVDKDKYDYLLEINNAYYNEKIDENNRNNQFLQLLNKDNNWVTFFVKSIIQDSAKKGYEKVLFPKGETAAKIEGHETLANELIRVNKDIDYINSLPENIKNSKIGVSPLKELEKLEKKKTDLKAQGIEKLKPIEAFYEIKVKNILDKVYGKDKIKTVTDEFSNSWYEIELTPKMGEAIDLNITKNVIEFTNTKVENLSYQSNYSLFNKKSLDTKSAVQEIFDNAKSETIKNAAEWILSVIDKNNVTISLAKISNKEGEFTGGFFNLNQNSISINDNYTRSEGHFQRVLLHEVIHALTVQPFVENLIFNNKDFIKLPNGNVDFNYNSFKFKENTNEATKIYIQKMVSLRNETYKHFENIYGKDQLEQLIENNDSRVYGLKNVKEFISEAMTNDIFRKELDKIYPNAFAKMIDGIITWFKDVFGTVKADSVLTQAVEAITKYTETKSPNEFYEGLTKGFVDVQTFDGEYKRQPRITTDDDIYFSIEKDNTDDINPKISRTELLSLVNATQNLVIDYFYNKKNREVDNNQSSKSYVKNELTEALSNGTYEQAQLLQKLEDNFDEIWSKSINKVNKKFGIEIDQEVSDEDQDLTSNDELEKDWDDRANQSISITASSSREIRWLIESTHKIDAQGNNVKNLITGLNEFLTVAEIPNLMDKLNPANTPNKMLEILDDLAKNFNPSYALIADKLRKDINLLNLFRSEFSKISRKSNIILFKTTDRGLEIVVKDEVKGLNLVNQIADELNVLTNYNIEESAYNSEADKAFRKATDKYIDLKNVLLNTDNPFSLDNKLTEKGQQMVDIFEEFSLILGVSRPLISKVAIESIVKNSRTVKDLGKYQTLFNQIFEVLKKGTKNNNNKNLFELAKIESQFATVVVESTGTNINGESIYLYSLPTFLDKLFKKLNDNSKEGMQEAENMLKDFAKDPSRQFDNWLWYSDREVDGKKDILENGFLFYDRVEDKKVFRGVNWEFLNNFYVTYFGGAKNTDTKDAQTYVDLGDNDYKMSLLSYYLSPTSEESKKAKDKLDVIGIALQTPSDGGVTRIIYSPRIALGTKSLTHENGTVEYKSEFDLQAEKPFQFPLKSKLYLGLYRTVLQEVERIRQANKEIFDETSLMSGIFVLNEELSKLKDLEGSVTEVNKQILKKINHLVQYYHYKEIKYKKDGKIDLDKTFLKKVGEFKIPTGNVFSFHNMIIKDSDNKFRRNALSKANNKSEFISLHDLDGVTSNGALTVLGKDQLSKIQDFIQEFAKQSVKLEMEQMGKFKESFKGKHSMIADGTYESFITEYTLNNYIGNVQQQLWFTGVSSFYKNKTDLTKRAKEVVAPGTNSSELGAKDFIASTIKDRILTSNTFNTLANKVKTKIIIEKKYQNKSFDANNINKKLSDKEIENLSELEKDVYNIMKPYLEINTGDAQGYITIEGLEELMLKNGKMTELYTQIFADLKSGKQLDSRAIKSLTAIKPFTYGLDYDSSLNLSVPFQLKLSYVPLIPQLIAGTELEKIEKVMKEKKISRLLFESAHKVGAKVIHNINNEDGTLNEEALSLLEGRTYSYGSEQLQLEVPEHLEDARNKLATQIAKLITANLSNNPIYQINGKKMTGKELREYYSDILIKNIEEDTQKLLNELKATQNNDGSWKLDKNALKKILEEEIDSRGLPENYRDALKLLKNGDFALPLFTSNMSKKWESILTSLFTNRIMRQKISGGSVVLSSTFGLNKIEQSQYNKTFSNSLFRGQENIPTIDENGNLVLSPTYDTLFKSDGISFANNIELAKSYGNRYSKNPYIIEIDKDYANKIYPLNKKGGSQSYGERVIGDEGEERFISKENIKIPKEKFTIHKNKINYNFKNTSTLHLIKEWAFQFVETDIAEHNRYGEGEGFATNDEEYYKKLKKEIDKRGVSNQELLFLKPFNPIEGDNLIKDALNKKESEELKEEDFSLYNKKRKEIEEKYFNNILDTKKEDSLFNEINSTIEKIKPIKGIEYISEKENDRTLRIKTDENGATVIEVIMGSWSKKFFGENGNRISINDIPKELREMIAYRIPTQAKHSIVVLEVVGFLPEEQKNTIITPDDIIAQMGSDFDIDKLFLMYKNFYKTSEGKFTIPKYTEDKDATEAALAELKKELKDINKLDKEAAKYKISSLLSDMGGLFEDAVDELKEEIGGLKELLGRSARENEIIDIYKAILTNPYHQKEMITPADFEDFKLAKQTINAIYSIDDNNISITTSLGQRMIRNRNIAGRALKGIAANFNSFGAIAQNSEMYVDSKNGYKQKVRISGQPVNEHDRVYDKKELIEKYGKENVKQLEDADFVEVVFTGLGWNKSDKYDLNIDNKVILENASQGIGASVDNAKDPIFDALNLSTFTYATAHSALLFGASTNHAIFSLRQPIIKKLNDNFFDNQSILESDSKGKEREAIRNEYKEKLYRLYFDNFKERLDKKIDEFNVLQDKKYEDKELDKKPYPYDSSKIIKSLDKGRKLSKALSAYLFNDDSKNVKSFSTAELYSMLEQDALDIQGKLSPKDQIVLYMNQLQVLNAFTINKNTSEKIENVLKVTKTDGIGAGPSIDVTDRLLANIEKSNEDALVLIDKDPAVSRIFVKNFLGTGKSAYPTAEAYLENVNKLSKQILSPLFIQHTEGFKELKKSFITSGVVVEERTSNLIDKYINRIILSDFDQFNEKYMEQVLGTSTYVEPKFSIDNFESYKQQSFHSKLEIMRDMFKDDLVNPNHVLNIFEVKDNFKNLGYREVGIKSYKDALSDDSFAEQLENMYFSDEFQKEFVIDLIKYTYFAHSLQYTFNSFAKIIPSNVLIDLGIGTHLYEKLEQYKTGVTLSEAAYEEFFRNNWSDKSIVPQVYTKWKRNEEGKIVTVSLLDENGQETGDVEQVTKDETPIWSQTNGVIKVSNQFLKNESNQIKKSLYVNLPIKTRTKEGKFETEYKLFRRSEFDYNLEEPSSYYYEVNKLGKNGVYESKKSIFVENNTTDEVENYKNAIVKEYGVEKDSVTNFPNSTQNQIEDTKNNCNIG